MCSKKLDLRLSLHTCNNYSTEIKKINLKFFVFLTKFDLFIFKPVRLFCKELCNTNSMGLTLHYSFKILTSLL